MISLRKEAQPVTGRSNEEWLADLRGPERDKALADLRMLLVRGLRAALTKHGKVSDQDLEDFAQDALLRITDALDSFRGEARFTTWAYRIAIHTALGELRRRRWRDVSLDDLHNATDPDFVPDTIADPSVGPEKQALQRVVLDTLRRAIEEDLTEKQRRALIAARVQGMPIAEVARRMDTNPNALYKLLHDARQRLQRALRDRGLPPEEVLAAFGLSAGVRTAQAAASVTQKAQGDEAESRAS
jgi:RNA polymerase sigma-70 factor (ECF subfamily)